MNRKALRGAGLALLAGVVLAWSGSYAADDKVPGIDVIMTKAHKKGEGILAKVGSELKNSTPDWSIIQKDTHELVGLGVALGKNKPPKGEQASWAKLTQAYLANARSLDGAAQAKSASSVLAYLKKLQTSCGACHKAHKL